MVYTSCRRGGRGWLENAPRSCSEVELTREEEKLSEAGVRKVNSLRFYTSTRVRTLTIIASMDRRLDALKRRKSLTSIASSGHKVARRHQGMDRKHFSNRHKEKRSMATFVPDRPYKSQKWREANSLKSVLTQDTEVNQVNDGVKRCRFIV